VVHRASTRLRSCDARGGAGASEVRTRRSRARARDWWFVAGGTGIVDVVSVFGVTERARRIVRVLERSDEKGVIKAGMCV
jgi:hypothetical protein